MKEISNEFKLLIEASQITPSANHIHAYIDEGLRSEYLLDLARANGVLPLIYHELRHYPQYTISDEIKEAVQEIKNTNFFMSAQLLQLIYLLQEKGINILPIKGPILAEHAYKDLGLRPFSDLDILAKETNLQEIADTLIAMGYHNEKELSTLSHPYILQNFSDLSFTHPDTGLIIELHWKLLKSAQAELSDISQLFERQITINFQNTQLPSLPLEEEFLYLCVHAAKHRFERIEWMNDLNRLYELYHKRFDWEKLLLLAKHEAYTNAYLLALSILKSHFNRSFSKTTHHLLHKKKIKKLHQKVFDLHADDYVLKKKKEGIRWMELSFSLQLEENLYRKLIVLKSTLFPLYMDDIIKIKKLPKFLGLLYYLSRLKRILGFK